MSNEIYLPDEASGVFHKIRFADFAVSWAGAGPVAHGFCFGSEDGRVIFTDEAGERKGSLDNVSASKEGINGLAWSRGWLAATTRDDMNFVGPRPDADSPLQAIAISGGAHDVVVAPSGRFVMPLGPEGIGFAKPGMTENDPFVVSKPDQCVLNFYRLVALPGKKGGDLIVCAGRRGGVGITEHREGIQGIVLDTVRFTDLDIVDVCSIGTAVNPLAIVAAGKDGSLIFFSDILHDKHPLTLKFKSIQGTLYRVLSTRGDVYALTSKGLFVIFDLATRFLEGLAKGKIDTNVLALPIEAADANMAHQKWLLAVGADDVFRFDLEQIARSPEVGIPEKRNGAADVLAVTSTPEEPDRLDSRPQWEQGGFCETKMAVAV